MATKAKATTKAAAASAAPGDEFKDLSVIEFGVENFMRVRAVTIRPTGSSVVLTGKNRQGKSSVIRALASVFAGKNALPGQPIRRGEDEARVWTILGKDGNPELTIEEVLKRKDGDEIGRTLTVTPADGRAYREPQALLNRLYAPIAFAPFDFSRMPAKEQLDIVKALVPGVDFEAIAEQRKALFEERTQVGRERDRAAAKVAGQRIPADPPTVEVDVAELSNTLRESVATNEQLAARRRTRAAAADEVEAKRAEIEQLEARIKTLTKEANDLDAKLAAAPALPEPIDVTRITTLIEGANLTNAEVRRWAAVRADGEVAKEREAEYLRLTKAIEQLDADKADAIEAADLPVRGLALADDGLLLNGLPFDQASGREKLETAVRIGMAMNPDLKLILAEEGALLDDEGLDVLEQLAAKHGFLVVIERVTNGEKVGFCIEDGSLAS